MNKYLSALLLSLTLLGGCASTTGCRGDACERADSDLRHLVIWWSPGMRGGLGSADQPLDHSSVPLYE